MNTGRSIRLIKKNINPTKNVNEQLQISSGARASLGISHLLLQYFTPVPKEFDLTICQIVYKIFVINVCYSVRLEKLKKFRLPQAVQKL